MTIAAPVKLSTDPRFDELNLVDCPNCQNKACMRVVNGFTTGDQTAVRVRWECSICHGRSWEKLEAPRMAPGSAQSAPDGQIGKCPRCQMEHQALFQYQLPNVMTEQRLCIRCISEMNQQIAELSDPPKSPSGRFVCDLCMSSTSRLVAIGEVWGCPECVEVCETLSEEEKLHFKNLKVN
jgi:hypothetical protein